MDAVPGRASKKTRSRVTAAVGFRPCDSVAGLCCDCVSVPYLLEVLTVPTPIEPDATPVITAEQGQTLAVEIKDDFLPLIQAYIVAAALASTTRQGYVDAQKKADDSMAALLAKQEQERTALSETNAAAIMAARDTWATAEAERKVAEKAFVDEANYVSSLAGGDPNAIDPTPTKPAPIDPTPVDPVDPSPVEPTPTEPPKPEPSPAPAMRPFLGGSIIGK